MKNRIGYSLSQKEKADKIFNGYTLPDWKNGHCLAKNLLIFSFWPIFVVISSCHVPVSNHEVYCVDSWTYKNSEMDPDKQH